MNFVTLPLLHVSNSMRHKFCQIYLENLILTNCWRINENLTCKLIYNGYRANQE